MQFMSQLRIDFKLYAALCISVFVHYICLSQLCILYQGNWEMQIKGKTNVQCFLHCVGDGHKLK